MDIAKKIIKNTTFNAAGYLWSTAINFFLVPYIFSKLGSERFGIWAVVFVITGYFGLLDFGIKGSFTRFIADSWAKDDHRKINEVVNVGFLFYLLFAGVISLIAFFFAPAIVRIIKVSGPVQEEATFALIGAIIIFGLSNSLGIFQSVINGLQRMEITNKIVILLSLPKILGTMIVLEFGYGLKGLIINNGIVMLFMAAISSLYAMRLFSHLKISIFQFSWKTFKELFNYGIRIQVSNLSGLVNLQTDKLLLAYFLNMTTVAFYELGHKITMLARSLPMLFFSALMPAAAEIYAKSDDIRVKKLYLKGSKYLYTIVIPVAFFLCISADIIMRVWMGRDYPISALVIRFLTIGYFINLLAGVATHIARGMGKVNYEVRSSTLVPVLNIILSIILIIKMGLIGALIATTFSVSVGSLYYILMFHKYIIKDTFIQFFKKIASKPIIFRVAATRLVFLFNHIIEMHIYISGRLAYLLLLCLDGIVFFLFYVYGISKSNYFLKEELAVVIRGLDLQKYFLRKDGTNEN